MLDSPSVQGGIARLVLPSKLGRNARAQQGGVESEQTLLQRMIQRAGEHAKGVVGHPDMLKRTAEGVCRASGPQPQQEKLKWPNRKDLLCMRECSFLLG